MKYINRNEIRKVLANYKEAVKQTELFFANPEVKELHKKEYELLDLDKIEESIAITEQLEEIQKEKYPLGTWGIVYNNAKVLVETMMKGIPEFKNDNVDIMNDVVFKPQLLKEFVELAERT